MLIRVANQFAFANQAPFRFSLAHEGSDTVRIEVELRQLPAATADVIRRKVERLTSIVSVEVRETPEGPQGAMTDGS